MDVIPLPIARYAVSPPISMWHPTYGSDYGKWEKWRRAYEGGKDFIDLYMQKLSDRETVADFDARKAIAYAPTFAKAAINDIKNAIFQRTADVARKDGPPSYMDAVKGLEGGVDLQGNTMGSFIGTETLPELLVLGRVGVLIDAPDDIGTTMRDKKGKNPFISTYVREDIVNWSPAKPTNGYATLLLRESVDQIDDFGLPTGTKTIFRLYQRQNNGVKVSFYANDGVEAIKEVFLDIPEIPFVSFDLPLSLMEDVADYQVALLNLESSDISFSRKANFPIYYEFYDSRSDGQHFKPQVEPGEEGADESRDREVKAGLADGRRINKGLDAPGFVNPDPETLRVSMEKGQQIREDIRLLVNLNLQNLNPRRQGADSKAMDAHSLEASLSYIGLVLQKGEMELGKHWNHFEKTQKRPSIVYPKSYNLKTEGERQEEADRLAKLQSKIPSDTYQREMAKKIVNLTMFDLPDSVIATIEEEVDNAQTLTSDPEQVLAAHEAGLVGDELASETLGYPNGEIERAQKDRAERIKLTLEAQGGPPDANRGAPDFGEGKDEKEGKPTRGPEK